MYHRIAMGLLLALLAGDSAAVAQEMSAIPAHGTPSKAVAKSPTGASMQDSMEVPSEAGIAFFESKIRPVLIEHCYDCHSSDAGAAEGGLRVDSRTAIRRGGEGGPAVVPGDPRASRLLKVVKHEDPDLTMPPKQPRLDASIIADLERWIEMGAPDPREADRAEDEKADGSGTAEPRWDLAAAREHWAYQKLTVSERKGLAGVQAVIATGESRADAWPRRDLDFFVLAELQAHDLAPSPDAPPEIFLRRLHFDLVGLPPGADDLEQFLRSVEDRGIDAAIEAEVDRLLASPRFGERWGRHWLDVARFGESSGKEANISFPYAWRYRDYVIDAFNDDVPFDRFITEQIAGDLLPYETDAERARLLVATGFLALGPKNLDETNKLQFFADVIDEQIDSVTRAVMASSIACARCHDHKFDPFSMQDYYALAGVFASTETFFGTAVSPANRIGGKPLRLPLGADLEILHDSIPAEQVARLRAELAALEKEERDGREAVGRAIAAGEDASELFTLTDALRIFWRSGAIQGTLDKVSDTGEALPLAMGVLDREQVIDVPLLQRGEISRPADPVPRAFPKIFSVEPAIPIPEDQSGRLQFAQWLTDPQHPLTSRVMVNRIWQHLFGTGLVRTVDNFGTTGEPPSHPELLDRLAVRFIQNGWSVKSMVREVVLSRTYRQSSEYDERAFLRDPDNRLLWRMSKRRLEAEAIRDAMLAVSGELELARPRGSLVGRVIGDRPISLIGLDKRLPPDLDGAVHRSVYLPVIRDRLPDVLDLFDFAEPSIVTGQRETTNVPLQALYLLNSPFVQDRAAAFAERLNSRTEDDRERIQLAFQWCYNRQPDLEEMTRSLEYLNASPQELDGTQEVAGSAEAVNADTPGGKEVEAPSRLASFCQALLSTAEFRNLD